MSMTLAGHAPTTPPPPPGEVTLTDGSAARRDAFHPESVRVEETEDYWIIPDTVAGRAGVFNGALRRREDLEKSWLTMSGVPVGLHHPPWDDVHGPGLLYVFPTEVHGFVDNVRWDDAEGAILVDVYLPKHDRVPGMEIPSANAEVNKRIVERLQDGEPVDVSPGYLTRVIYQEGEENGTDFYEIRSDFMYYHLAIVPHGACGWEDACGLGRGQRHGEGDQARADAAGCACPLTSAREGAAHSHGHNGPAGAAARDNEQQREFEMSNQNPQQKTKPAGDAGDPNAGASGAESRALGATSAHDSEVLRAVKGLQDCATTIQTDVKGLAQRVDEMEKRQREADNARVRGKRDELARLRGLQDEEDVKALEAYPEVALDREIAREKALKERVDRARADGLQWGEGGEDPAPAIPPTIGAVDVRSGSWVNGRESLNGKGKGGEA